jgi:two-component system nitrate/nitrite response regulator NarL
MDAHVKVAIIHHHRLLRESLGYALSQVPGISLCCQISSLDEVPRNWDGPCPDIVLIEMADGSRDFLARVGNLKAECPGCRIIMLDVPECDETVLACIEVAGVMGYLTKTRSLDDLSQTIRSVTSGEAMCPPRVANLLFSRVSELSRQVASVSSQSANGLTCREQAIVSAIEKGLSNKEIAVQLGIEVSTVKNHVHNILDKLHLHDRQSVVRYVKQHGLGASAH